ncbi:MAG TPA: hypothetical protein PKH39_18855 [Woeseiaceae bacterium]|nr:hypothetical protein [Woeseiaceae bacterium]
MSARLGHQRGESRDEVLRLLVLCGVPYYAAEKRAEIQDKFLKPYVFWKGPEYFDAMYKRIAVNGDPQYPRNAGSALH